MVKNNNTDPIKLQLKPLIEVGQTINNFNLNDQKGTKHDLYKILESGKRVLLVIYPKDNTPGCTDQLCRIRDDYSQFTKLGVVILGLNNDGEVSHQKFIDNFNFPFDILIDSNKNVIQELGATKLFFKNITIARSVILIDTNKKVLYTKKGQQDNQEIINLLKNL
jgi:thioredoxin-dependent peroxiredoxin